MGALVLLTLLGSSLSLVRISEVSRRLDSINHVTFPLGRLLTQIQSDAEIFQRELERRLGRDHWSASKWKARPMPRWVEDVLIQEFNRARQIIQKDQSTLLNQVEWEAWVTKASDGLRLLMEDSASLNQALAVHGNSEAALEISSRMNGQLIEWLNSIEWAVNEHEALARRTFSESESRVANLRTGLQVILMVVISLSLLLLWLGERALRPIDELSRLARQIATRGLRREDKESLPHLLTGAVGQGDEISQLSREFHGMATALLEREKVVESQKTRLEEQNQLLRDLGALNESVLKSMNSILVVVDADGTIRKVNSQFASWTSKHSPTDKAVSAVGLRLDQIQWLRGALGAFQDPSIAEAEVDHEWSGRKLKVRVAPLEMGWVIEVFDRTEELELSERLRNAEQFAAVGRLSAQVAHEIRNPLHSMGLEAELALEQLPKQPETLEVRQSLQSIQASIERLAKITENYLKLSRLSSGKKSRMDLGQVVEEVLALYSPMLQAQKIQMDWARTGTQAEGAYFWIQGDQDLLEQALGNLIKNSMQALQETEESHRKIRVGLDFQDHKCCVRIEDSGPGLPQEVESRLFSPYVTTKANGTGLGLSFVKHAVEEQGGTVHYSRSKDLGGASFEWRIPAVAAQSVDTKSEVMNELS
ncbi:MAG: GHKL domain-containing protein [Bdellovibrionales bacterium]|nr:GHKL domain-containing protein [Bdellovibrionales bacterium]